MTNRCATDIDVDFYGPNVRPTGWSTIKAGERGGAGDESPDRIELEVIVRRTGTEGPVLTRRLTKEDLAVLVVERSGGNQYMNVVVEGELCP